MPGVGPTRDTYSIARSSTRHERQGRRDKRRPIAGFPDRPAPTGARSRCTGVDAYLWYPFDHRCLASRSRGKCILRLLRWADSAPSRSCRCRCRLRELRGGGERPQCQIMMNFTELASVPSDGLVPFTDQLRLAVAAYLARFEGSSRDHTESDLRCFLAWCAERGLDPLAARRPHLDLYIRWMQEIRRFKPPTVSRRFSVAAGFYRTCAIDGLLERSPADHVRRPTVPAESPTLGGRASPGASSRAPPILLETSTRSPGRYTPFPGRSTGFKHCSADAGLETRWRQFRHAVRVTRSASTGDRSDGFDLDKDIGPEKGRDLYE